MPGTEAIRHALTSSQAVLTMFLGDLSDADLLVRLVHTANHIAWQLGHLIATESHLLAAQLPRPPASALHWAGDRGCPRYVTRTRPTGGTDSSPPNLEQAERMLEVAAEFGVGRILSMCPPDDIPPLRERFGDRMGFVGPIAKKLDEPDEAALQLLDRFLELGVVWLKFWAAPRGRESGLFLDAHADLVFRCSLEEGE